MPNFTSPTLSADRASIATIQAAFDALETLLDTVVTFSGATIPNVMTGDIDMNSNTLLNFILQLNVVAATAIADINNAVNTSNKAEGRVVYDSTNNRIMVASGATAGDSWFDAVGSNEVAPA